LSLVEVLIGFDGAKIGSVLRGFPTSRHKGTLKTDKLARLTILNHSSALIFISLEGVMPILFCTFVQGVGLTIPSGCAGVVGVKGLKCHFKAVIGLITQGNLTHSWPELSIFMGPVDVVSHLEFGVP
jgi:hypothetical protein